eukprot:GEMP01005644.1.p1 GENE.GEMP01005644.1~~GEMP01005644.1.p1  ORF type:complete len:1028 (+),score=164.68 GEMP01005644.1:192-3275(+)
MPAAEDVSDNENYAAVRKSVLKKGGSTNPSESRLRSVSIAQPSISSSLDSLGLQLGYEQPGRLTEQDSEWGADQIGANARGSTDSPPEGGSFDLPIASERYTRIGMSTPESTERARKTLNLSSDYGSFEMPIASERHTRFSMSTPESTERPRKTQNFSLDDGGSDTPIASERNTRSSLHIPGDAERHPQMYKAAQDASPSSIEHDVDVAGGRTHSMKNILAHSTNIGRSSSMLESEDDANFVSQPDSRSLSDRMVARDDDEDAPGATEQYSSEVHGYSGGRSTTTPSLDTTVKNVGLARVLSEYTRPLPAKTLFDSESESEFDAFLLGDHIKAGGANVSDRVLLRSPPFGELSPMPESQRWRVSLVTPKKPISQPVSRDSALDDNILRNSTFWKPFLQHDRRRKSDNGGLLSGSNLLDNASYATDFADVEPVVRGILRTMEEPGFDPAGFEKHDIKGLIPPHDGQAGIFAPPTGRKYVVGLRRPTLAEFVERVLPILGVRRLSNKDLRHMFENIEDYHKDTQLGRNGQIAVLQETMGSRYGIHPQSSLAIYTTYEMMCGEYHGAFYPPFDFRLKNVDNLLLVQEAYGEAARNGLQKGDVLVSANSTTVGNMHERDAYELLNNLASHSKYPVVLHWMRVDFTLRPQWDSGARSPPCQFVTLDPLSPEHKASSEGRTDSGDCVQKNLRYDLQWRTVDDTDESESGLAQPSLPSSVEMMDVFDASDKVARNCIECGEFSEQETELRRDVAGKKWTLEKEQANAHNLFRKTGSPAKMSPPRAAEASPTRLQRNNNSRKCEATVFLQNNLVRVPKPIVKPRARSQAPVLRKMRLPQNSGCTASSTYSRLISHTQVSKLPSVSSRVPTCCAVLFADKASGPSRSHLSGWVTPSSQRGDPLSLNGELLPPRDPKQIWNGSQQTCDGSPSHSRVADCKQEQENEQTEPGLEDNVDTKPAGRSSFERELEKESTTNSAVAMSLYDMLAQGPYCKDEDKGSVCTISPSLLFIVTNKECVRSLREKKTKMEFPPVFDK